MTRDALNGRRVEGRRSEADGLRIGGRKTASDGQSGEGWQYEQLRVITAACSAASNSGAAVERPSVPWQLLNPIPAHGDGERGGGCALGRQYRIQRVYCVWVPATVSRRVAEWKRVEVRGSAKDPHWFNLLARR